MSNQYHSTRNNKPTTTVLISELVSLRKITPYNKDPEEQKTHLKSSGDQAQPVWHKVIMAAITCTSKLIATK